MNLDTPVKSVMSTDLVTVFAQTSFDEVQEIFKSNNFHHVPVIDQNNTIIGIISKTDWLEKLQWLATHTGGKTWSRKYLKSLCAEEIMTPVPICLFPEDCISLAANLLAENKYHAIPIVDDDQLVGILTTHDLIVYAFYQAPVGNA